MPVLGERTALIASRRLLFLVVASAGRAGVGRLEEELLHVPGAGRAALGAQAAMQADVFVLDHDAHGLQRAGEVKVLREVQGGRVQAGTKILFVPVGSKGNAV